MEKIILFALFFLGYLLINIYENYFREKWKYSENYKFYSRKWHSIQFIRWSLVLVYVVYIVFDIKGLILLLPLSAVWKIFFDGGLNVLRGRGFWYQSSYHDLSVLEKYNTPIAKIIFLLVTICIAVLFYIKVKL